MFGSRRRGRERPAKAGGAVSSRAPGRRTRAQEIQRRGRGRGRVREPAAIRDQAAGGIEDQPATSLPRREAIQASFGPYDVSGVKAHVGGEAAASCDAIGAEAYASGSHVAFRGAPSLHTAAHEAAHVVQQRGGVQLKAGVGEAGDAYERHADEVADAVVAGRSAAGLLGRMNPDRSAPGRGGAVQRSEAEAEPEAGAGDEQVCRELTEEELLDVLGRIVTGDPVTETERLNVRATIENWDNEQFTKMVRLADAFGTLAAITRGLYESPGEEGGGDDQFEVPVVCYRFWNAEDRVDEDVDQANLIFNHHGIYIVKAAHREISQGEIEEVLDHDVDDDFQLDRTYERRGGNKRYTHDDMVAVMRRYVPSSVIGGLWVKSVINQDGNRLAGTSSREATFGAGYHRLAMVATDGAGPDTFAHELGHILINEGHTDDTLMESGSSRDKTLHGPDRLTDDQIDRIKSSVLGWARRGD